ncbi:alpha/beta hydrolase [Devosia sp.]|uniref:alpha/beta fold hydrolase n=1 Tax=Devosia sp. TaxID=1871048 RepID=UPI0025D03CF1|nr:alpha/beta hydrolase [Devosia sp.]MCR6634296.1 alpha/beta hydrolase [Devosia sp.]
MDEFTIDIDGATLTGVEMGDGLPVVFLHAGVCDNRMWHDQMRLAADNGWHAIAYDRRGYGDAESPDEPFSHLEDLEAILDAFDIHAAIFVGCSMGGGLAIDFALSHPGRVIGLVLIGTSVTGAPWSATAEESAIEMAEEDAWERGDLDLLNKVQAHEWLDGPRAQSGRVGGSVRELFLDMNAKALAKPELTQEEPRPDAWSRVDAVTSPTMLIVGDEDFSALIDRHEHLSETMPNSFAAVLEGVAHIPSIERPDLINRMLEEFLDALAGEDLEPDDDE